MCYRLRVVYTAKKEIKGSAHQQINRQLLLFASYPLVAASYRSLLAQGSVDHGASIASGYLDQNHTSRTEIVHTSSDQDCNFGDEKTKRVETREAESKNCVESE